MTIAPKDRRKVDEVKAVVGDHVSDKEVLKVLKSVRWNVPAAIESWYERDMTTQDSEERKAGEADGLGSLYAGQDKQQKPRKK